MIFIDSFLIFCVLLIIFLFQLVTPPPRSFHKNFPLCVPSQLLFLGRKYPLPFASRLGSPSGLGAPQRRFPGSWREHPGSCAAQSYRTSQERFFGTRFLRFCPKTEFCSITFPASDKPSDLILTDFDGTLTRRDSFPQFLRFVLGKNYFLWAPLFLYYIFLLKIGATSPQRVKEHILSLALHGWPQERVRQAGRAFIAHLLKHRNEAFWPGALEMLETCRSGGSRVIVVSASPEEWVAPFAEIMGVEYIATRLEYDEHGFTGRLAGKNCNGEEKVRRITSLVSDIGVRHIKAYGDSAGDLPMLALAHEGFYKPFHPGGGKER